MNISERQTLFNLLVNIIYINYKKQEPTLLFCNA